MPPFLAIQHLDDVVTVDGSADRAGKFFSTYRSICGELGISLASVEDPTKSFGPSQEGLCLGIVFNTVQWIWRLEREKIVRYINDLNDLAGSEKATIKEIKSVNGKLIYIMPLVVGGRHRISHIMKLAHSSDNLRTTVAVTEEVKNDIRWWI